MRHALCAMRDVETSMPAIPLIGDLGADQEELLETSDINELKKVFKRWRRIGWKTSVSYGFRSGHQNTIER